MKKTANERDSLGCFLSHSVNFNLEIRNWKHCRRKFFSYVTGLMPKCEAKNRETLLSHFFQGVTSARKKEK